MDQDPVYPFAIGIQYPITEALMESDRQVVFDCISEGAFRKNFLRSNLV